MALIGRAGGVVTPLSNPEPRSRKEAGFYRSNAGPISRAKCGLLGDDVTRFHADDGWP